MDERFPEFIEKSDEMMSGVSIEIEEPDSSFDMEVVLDSSSDERSERRAEMRLLRR